MSFLSDLFHGNTGNLGHDLNPSNIFSDTGSDIMKGLKNPGVDVGLAALTAIAAPYLLPELGAGLGIGTAAGTAADLGGAAVADAGLGATTTAGTDALGFAGDVAGSDLTSFLANPAATTAGGGATAATSLPTDALALTAPTTAAADTAGAASTVTAGLNAATDPLAATAGGGTGILDTLSSAVSPISSALKTATPFIGAGGLGLNLYEGYQQKKQLNALNATEKLNAANAAATASTENAAAQPLLSQGQTLMSYLTTGTLPQAFQAQLDQQIAAQKAGIIQGYAAKGMSTNPQQNSALQQDLAAVDQQALTTKANMEQTLQTAGNQMVQTANTLLAQGLSATQLSAEIPIQISQLNSQLNQQMVQAISGFAAAVNGGAGGGQKFSLVSTS